MGGLGLEALLPALVHRIPSGFLPTENKTQSTQRTDRSVSLSWGCPLSRWVGRQQARQAARGP